MPTTVNTSSVISAGSTGGVGYSKVADAADIDTIYQGYINDTAPIPTGRQIDIPIDVRGRIVAIRILANDGLDPPGAGTIEVELGHAKLDNYPAVGKIIATINTAGDFVKKQDLAESAAVDIEPGAYLSFTITENDVVRRVLVWIMYQRSSGSNRPTDNSTPSIMSVSVSQNASGDKIFTVSADRPVRSQIEYGPTTSYGSKSAVSEIQSKTTTITIPGFTSGFYRAHVTDSNGHETLGSNQPI